MGDVIDFARRPRRVGGFDIVADSTQPLADAYQFEEKPPAKSSTSVLKAGVCQKCGCKLDGKIESIKPGCECRCHKNGPNAKNL